MTEQLPPVDPETGVVLEQPNLFPTDEELIANRQRSSWSFRSFMRRALPDPKPRQAPLNFVRPPTLAEQVARLVRQETRAMQNPERDVPDDEDEWEDDDGNPFSPYELIWDPHLEREVTASEFMANQEKYRLAYLKKAAEGTYTDPVNPLPRTSKKPSTASPKGKEPRSQKAGGDDAPPESGDDA